MMLGHENPHQASATDVKTLILLASPFLAGATVYIATGAVVEEYAPFAEGYVAQREIGNQIAALEIENTNVSKPREIVEAHGANTAGIDAVIEENTEKISVLETEKDQYGNETVNAAEFYILPLALGAAVLGYAMKKSIKKIKQLRN